MNNGTSMIVLSADSETGATWCVNTGVLIDQRDSRLTGAWQVSVDDLGTLHIDATSRCVLPVDPASAKTAKQIWPNLPHTSLQQIEAAVVAETGRLQALFDAEMTKRTKSMQLLPPQWPTVDVPTRAVLDGAETLIDKALKTARRLADLANAWDVVERERLARPFLRLDAAQTRPLPMR